MKCTCSFLSAAILALLLPACAGKKITAYPHHVVAVPQEEEGTITIHSTGEGASEPEAVRYAETKAFNTLLFYGLPSSAQTRPMIENEQEAKSHNATFFTTFFDKQGYRDFITNGANQAPVQRVGRYFYLDRSITINLRSLRAHLENNHIIRKFGY